jgi:hypothetical protein
MSEVYMRNYEDRASCGAVAASTVAAEFTVEERALLEPVALKLLQGLLQSHFAPRRGPGRPRKGSEIQRVTKGFRAMVRASCSGMPAAEAQLLFQRLINRSLF